MEKKTTAHFKVRKWTEKKQARTYVTVLEGKSGFVKRGKYQPLNL